MASENKVTLKLLIDKKTKKVLFAEAGKEFVDFLFTLLSFPLGTVIRLLSKKQMVGCLGNLYQSIEELSDSFIQPSQSKDSVLKPKVQLYTTDVNILLTDANGNGTAPSSKKLYMCPNNHANVTDNPSTECPTCPHYQSRQMDREVKFVGMAASNFNQNNNNKTGFVKGVVTYMVMDNLEVKPMSTISSITLLNQFNIQQVGLLEEKVVELGMDEGLKLLKASLQSKTVLTTVFLGA